MDRISEAVATGAPVVVLSGVHSNGLARRWVEAHRTEFIGGYLAVDLNAYRITGGVDLRAIMAQCLRALDTINRPRTFVERVNLYRACVQWRGRMVIGLDNADQAAQVRPFVVPNSVVLVSGRWKLGGLVTERAHFLEV